MRSDRSAAEIVRVTRPLLANWSRDQSPLSLEFEPTGAQIVAARDGRGFGEVELGIVGTQKMWTAEVCDLAAG